MNGKVKFFNDEKGWGWIITEQGNEVFVHHTGIVGKGRKSLQEGQIVSFDVTQGDKGPRAINVVPNEEGYKPDTSGPARKASPIVKAARDNNPDTTFPYGFIKRPNLAKQMPVFHNQLLEDHFDIAFDITWKTLSPTALNPCSAEGDKNCPNGDKDHYAGYDKRWLTIGERLAISPFTVKSAIANGFANLIGGCYRVMPKDRIEKHKDDIKQGKYPYTGAYKRYRVAMDGSSRPGIIIKKTIEEDGDWSVTIQPVREYYLNEDLPVPLVRGAKVSYTIKERRGHNHKPDIIDNVKANAAGTVEYYGLYTHGMNGAGRFKRKVHEHRFIEPIGGTVSGRIHKHDLGDKTAHAALVYMGNYRQRPEDKGTGELWYDDLRGIGKGDFVYYEIFGGQVTNIGKNFLFKALFLHEDAVPDDQKACSDIDELCPRCRMFGLTTGHDGENEVGGLKGRFKSSTLISVVRCAESDDEYTVPVKDYDNSPYKSKKVSIRKWENSDENIIAQQFLLPLQGPPKPNKRDVNRGYFNRESGEIEGAKQYLHGAMNFVSEEGKEAESLDKLNSYIKEIDKQKTIDKKNPDSMPYTHELRRYGVVCRQGLDFSGTVGAENCSKEEIAAMVALLDSSNGHGFRIGLCRNLGLGSIESRINHVRLRTAQKYNEWEKLTLPEFFDKFKDIDKQVKSFELLDDKSFVQTRTLGFPQPGPRYWSKRIR